LTAVRLPHTLMNTLDIVALNRRLRDGTVTLDWSDVRYAAPQALSTLLADLDLVEDADAIGIATVPDALAPKLEAACSPRRQDPPGGPKREQGSRQPTAWRAARPPEAPDQNDTAAADQTETARLGVATPGPILAVPSPHAVRAELEDAVLRDLLGPAGGPTEEIDEGSVRDRYLVGLLAPRGQTLLPEQNDELAVAGTGTLEDGQSDTNALQARSMFPSSFGLTFSVTGDAATIKVTCRWGAYERVRSETLVNEKTGAPKLVWQRTPVEGMSPPIPLVPGPIVPWVPDPERPDAHVQGRVRRVGDDWVVSLFLINNQKEPRQLGDRAWLFQPEIVVDAPDGAAIFRRRPHLHEPENGGNEDVDLVAEQRGLAMIYRRRVEFAVGHGVAVHVDVVPDAPDQASRVMTRIVPTYDVAKTTSPTSADVPALAGLVLDMKWLSELNAAEIVPALSALPTAYAAWITAQRDRVADPAAALSDYQDAAEAALDRCTDVLARIRAGLDLLGRDAQAADAFRFMNRAMWLQRTRSLYAEDRRRGMAPDMAVIDIPRNRTWFPFQLAFILINLPSIADVHHPDRREDADAIADLLWFPTGGGKTEAYLGLTAYTLAVRRLQGVVAGHDGENGVVVLMRYTLRLLTLQQFQRAAALICACEAIRREGAAAGDTRWGQTPFRVGLWVGQRTTPNTTQQADEAIKQAHGQAPKGSAMGGSGSPAQLTNCPWCGASIDAGRHIKVEPASSGRGRTLIYCGDPFGDCPFSERQAPGEGLPVLVVDEEIYRLLPALLIATVDKFAQMPWNGATAMLFGRVSGYCPRHGFRSPELKDSDSHPARTGLPRAETRPHAPLRPPDLVIQDELHLISGPLGTLVGLYETAVDQLACWEVDGQTVRPKVIASTATIRQARTQVHRLFLRRVEIFPPQGLDAENNFFAIQRPSDDAYPGRRYIGICAPGRRLKAVLIRVYVAYMAAAQQIYEKYGKAADPWMTLVGYFNSMRELGGMRRLVDDDVRSRLQKMDDRGLSKRRAPILEELTSRKSSTDIPLLLDRLERQFDPANEFKKGAQTGGRGKGSGVPLPLDVLLATNMISVGVDVKRLGLMVVSGQPKSTSEYIQATSRVGRSAPGLVCAVFNWARPRDLSHYERFEHFHATFYQHVEALSVTPFAARAVNRGLAALLVSLVRLAGTEFNENKGAARITRDHPYVQRAIASITARAGAIEADQQAGVAAELESRVQDWLQAASNGTGPQSLGYRSESDGITVGLLSKPAIGPWQHFTVLNSLRDVEPSVGLILDDGVGGDVGEWTGTSAGAPDDADEDDAGEDAL